MIFVNLDKIAEMFESGEKMQAVEMLEKYVSTKTKLTQKTTKAYSDLLEFKYKLGMDCSKEASVLENADADDLWGFTFFMLGLHFEKTGNTEKACIYFKTFAERVNDPQEFADILGYPDEWKRIEKAYFSLENDESTDLFEVSDFGSDVEKLTENEQIFVLCTGFVEEVNSGGFEAYFSTGYSKHCLKTADYLESFKSKIYPRMLRKAIALFPESFDFSDPMATEDYLDKHEKILDKFEKLEEKIYESTEDIDAILERLKEQIK